MRKVTNINDNWEFEINGNISSVDLPHCWNSADGLKKDYIRTKCRYSRKIQFESERAFLFIEGANSVCTVEVEGKVLCTHKGGYGAFAVDVSGYNDKVVDIFVDNSDFPDVYPSTADFTFWGGLYRNVSLVETDNTHFSFRDFSSKGVYATPKCENGKWSVDIKALIDNPVGKVKFSLFDNENNIVSSAEEKAENEINTSLAVDNPILWNGIVNPYLYTLKAEIIGKDSLDIKIGFRTYYIDSEKGFFLNGRQIKLKGVSRHQDREGMGNGITEKEHKEDLELISELGANSVRLAHYQQNDYFYSLCDEMGMLVWAESPIISSFSAEKQENAKSQLTELVKQNYNHTSIFCWGIQNEISQNRKGAVDKALVPCMRELNTLVKSLDSTRYSTCAQLSILDENSPLNKITDIEGYNLYYGWYDFSFPFLERWLNDFHKDFPKTRLCLSEYGAEGLVDLHSANPVQGDYSEEYQCIFHENYIKAINSRDWLWGSYVWNMFDFGASNRREGGVVGKNNKGLVTYDRKTKKDSFYLYKAFWSDAPFTHICGERFVNRVAGKTDIKVYSNLHSVTLLANGREYTQTGDKIFIFKDIEIALGENILSADEHTIKINGVTAPDESYTLTSEKSFVRNWAEKEDKENYLSPESTIRELVKSRDAHIMVEGKMGEDKLNKPILKLIYPMKIKTALKIAVHFGLTENHRRLLTEYTYAIHK